jgi:phosphoserine phosphatase
MNVAFDIDDTLWKVQIRKSKGAVLGEQVPDFDVIQVLRWFAANGDHVYVWSAGGTDYAQQIVDKLGITDLVEVIPKHRQRGEFDPYIDLSFDDEDVILGAANCRVKRADHEETYKQLVAELKEDAARTTTTQP